MEILEVENKSSFSLLLSSPNSIIISFYYLLSANQKKNNLSFFQGCVVKYVCRYLYKNKIEDLEKIIHYCELEILKLKDTRNKK